MIQEKKLKQTNSLAGEYLAPRVKVVEFKTHRVLCVSGMMTEDGKEGNTSSWY